MAELTFTPIFQEIVHTFRNEPFSAMYFGRHCGKNLLILKHDLTIMLGFGDDIQRSNPDLVKSVTTRGESVRGIQIVGNEDIILMLDESGSMWRLINAFDVCEEGFESLHSLTNECFYEWIPFKKFNFAKILAVCAMKQGFACIGVSLKFEKKLAVLSSLDLPVEEFTFDGLNAPHSFSYSLTYLDIDIEKSAFKNKLDSTKEAFLVTDRLRGITYLCTKNGRYCLINNSNISLISTLCYYEEKCVILCYESGKLIFYFYNEPERQCIVYLPRKLVVVEKCCCFSFCFLWTDGINLNHSKFTVESGTPSSVKISHFKLHCSIQSPLSFLKIQCGILTTTMNNIYYLITASSVPGVQINRNRKEVLNDINKSSQNIDELEQKIDLLSYYLYCKDTMENFNINEKIEIIWEENSLLIKSLLEMCLRHEFWKLRLQMKECEKEVFHMIDFKFDISKGTCIRVNNPFSSEGKVKVSLIGDFGRRSLFFDLGEIGNPRTDFKKSRIRKGIENILSKKNPACVNI